MNFLTPLMLVGLVGAAVPIVIHLIGRRKAPTRKLATMDFLLGTNRRVARRLRLREMLLLFLRVLSCVAIPLALAKPFVSCSTGGVTVERGPQAVVLVLDDSYTMGWREDGETLFDRARERALRVLEQLGPEAEVAIERVAEGSEPAAELSRDHLRLRDEIDGAELTARPAQTALALRRAAALLTTSSHGARRVYLFSALAASGFKPGEPLWPEGGPELVVVPLEEGLLPNVALTAAWAEKEPDLGARGVAVTVKVQSFGGAKVTDHAVTLRIGGKAVARGLVTLGAGESAQKRFTAVLPPDTRATEVTVELDGDTLAVDDRRYLRVELRRDVRVLLVDGDPRAVRHEDELFYLETALRPGDRADSAVVVTTTTVDELARRKLSEFDVIFLCNVKPLDARLADELAAWVEHGGGLAVTVGDNVDAEAYDATMAPLLARRLRSARQLSTGSKGEDAARVEHLGRFEATHPIFTVFSARAAGLREASFWKIFLVEQAEGNVETTTLAHFSGGAPALIEARRGEGRLLLFTSSIDRDWNDLAIHPGFLPMVQQLARHLARSPVEDRETELVVGRARQLDVTEGDQRIEVTAPDGDRTVFEGARLKGRTQVTFTGVDRPGFYEIVADSGPDADTRRVVPGFVANLDPRGSDTTRLAPTELNAGAKATATTPQAARRRVELWHGLAAALLLFLLGEAVLTLRG